MDNKEPKPFTYAAELFLTTTKALGDLTDALLEGKVTNHHLLKWQFEVEAKLAEMKIELLGAYITSGSATDDFFTKVREEIQNSTKGL